MIKFRISEFPGMRPGSHTIDEIVLVNYRGNVKQVIKADDADLEVSAGRHKGKKRLLFLEGPPRLPEMRIPLVVVLFIFFFGMMFDRMIF